MNPKKLVEPKKFLEPLCAEVGPSFFYIDDKDDDTIDESSANLTYDVALSICKNCKHITECAEWGIYKERWGVWGGLTPLDRTLIRKKRRINLLDYR